MCRFGVVKKNNVFWIKDMMYETFKCPEMAVILYFKTELRAETICNILNAEWQEFCLDPI